MIKEDRIKLCKQLVFITSIVCLGEMIINSFILVHFASRLSGTNAIITILIGTLLNIFIGCIIAYRLGNKFTLRAQKLKLYEGIEHEYI